MKTLHRRILSLLLAAMIAGSTCNPVAFAAPEAESDVVPGTNPPSAILDVGNADTGPNPLGDPAEQSPGSQGNSSPGSSTAQPGDGADPAGEPGAEDSTDPTGEPGAEGGTNPTGKPGAEGGTDPAGEPGAEGGTDPAGEPGAEGGTDPAGEPGAEGGTDPAGEPGAEGSTGPAGEPGAEGETDPNGEGQLEGDSLEELESDPNAAPDPNPEKLNLEALVDEGFAALRSTMLLTQDLPGHTILLGSDNEDNAYSGQPDGDMDVFVRNSYPTHPIEVRLEVEETQLPQESAVLAIKAFDVDEESGEIDTVYWNGVEIGRLSGTDQTWNTTVLEVPLNLIRSGGNYVEITVSNGWVVKIDWFQLLLDGGEKDAAVQSFDIELGNPTAWRNSQGEITSLSLPVIVTLGISGEKNYLTEYSLLDQEGNVIASAFGQTDQSTSQTADLTFRNPGTGTYQVVGLLKDPDTEQIYARDEVNWYFNAEDPSLDVPRVQAVISQSQAQQEVRIFFNAMGWNGVEILSLYSEYFGVGEKKSSMSCYATENMSQSVDIDVEYTVDGVLKTATVPVWIAVENIDRVAPEIQLPETLEVSEGLTDDWVKEQVLALARVTDTVSAGGSPKFAGIKELTCQLSCQNISAAGGTATVTAVDYAGNTAQKTITIAKRSQPLQLGMPTAVRETGADTFRLGAELVSDGGLNVTATGFVWGVMQNPTVDVNNGKSVSSPTVGKGGTISAKAAIVDGVTYYARAYLTAGGTTYYSQQVSFGINAKNYGTLSIVNNNNNTFTISRDGTDGDQTVYYRTVNGSAVGGTHFAHRAGSVTIKDGEKTAAVTITEYDVNTPYSGEEPATGYSNAPRTYQVEIYRAEGGAAIGENSRATRTMDGNQTADRSFFAEYEVKGPQGEKLRGDYQDDKDEDGNLLGWGEGENSIGVAAIETAAVNQDGADYWKNTAQSIRYYITFDAKEQESGYQAIQILAGTTLDTRLYPYDDAFVGTISSTNVQYAALFEHGKDKKNTNWLSYRFPVDANDTAAGNFPSDSTLTKSLYHSSQSGQSKLYVTFPLDTTYITAGFGACGKDSDKWYTRYLVHHIQVYDDQEPQLLGIAPLAATTYKPGDQVTLSLVFDEIVDKENSKGIEEVSLNTSWGEFRYAGGADTNVLYFTGTVPDNAAGNITVDSIVNANLIKDMCEATKTSTSQDGDSVNASVDTTVPTISITADKVENGTASAKVTVTNDNSPQYVWTQSKAMPVNGWQEFSSGDTLSTRQAAGETWYLHILAEYSATGAIAHTYKEFKFPENAVLPTLTVSAGSDDGWVRQRTITLSYTPATATVTMTGPDGSKQVSAGNFTVTQNGWYSFTLTSGEETLTQAVEIQNIDREAPVVEELRQPTQATPPAASLTFSGVFSDALSGIKSVEYVFNQSPGTPASGWDTATASGGRYLFTYTSRSQDEETVYLHLKITDNAGNTLTRNSGAYKVQAAPAGDLTVTLSGVSDTWQAGAATLTWTLEGANSDGPFTLYGISSQGSTTETKTSGTFLAVQNGLYTVTVTDSRGRTGEASVLVNNIDTQPPTGRVAVPSGWTNQPKTVTLSGAGDNGTPLYDSNGRVTGYGGSGLAKKQYKLASADDSTAVEIPGDSFEVAENGEYFLILTDSLGNQSRQLFTVSGIDTDPPEADLSSSNYGSSQDWQQEVEVTLSFSDAGSGIASVKTGFTSSNTSRPASGLTEHPDFDGGTVSVSTTGSSHRYLYYEVTDLAGNTAWGFSPAIYADGDAPAISSITQPAGLENQQEQAVLEVTVSGVQSGVTLYHSADGRDYEPLPSGDVTLTAPGDHWFKAVSGAGVESEAQQVTLYQVTLDPGNGDFLPFRLVLEGGTVAEPQDPARTGYTFDGWRKGGADYDFTQGVGESFALTAGWQLNDPSLSITSAYNDSDTEPFVYNKGDLVFTAHPAHPAAGTTYTFQWYDADGEAIPGETGESYSIPAANAGEYICFCTVTATAGGLTSSVQQKATASIQKQEVPVPAEDDSIFTYNGEEQTYEIPDDSRYSVQGATQTEAGKYTVTVSLLDTDNYQWEDGGTAPKSYPFVIAKAPVAFEVSDNSLNYSEQEQSAQVTPRTHVEGLTVSSEDYTVRYEQEGETVTPVDKGSYDVIVTLLNPNLEFEEGDGTLREQKVGILTILGVPYPEADAITWPEAASLTYGQTLAESSLTGGDQWDAGSYAWKSPDTIPTVENPGCTVVFTPDDTNYPPVEHTIAVEVAPKELTISGVSAETRVYDPNDTTVTLTGGTLVGVVTREGALDDVTLDSSGAQGSIAAPDAGENLPVAVSGFALAGEDAVNYTLKQPDYVTVTITPAQGAATVTIAGWTYGEAPSQPVVSSETNGEANVTYRYTGTLANGTTPYDSATPPTDAGSYQVEATFAATNNYQQVTKQASFTVEQHTISATWNKLDTVYNAAPQAPAVVELIGVLEPDLGKVSASAEASAQTGAGDYTVSAELSGERAHNYTLHNRTQSFTIRPAPVTFQVEENSVQYNGQSHTPQVTAEALGQAFTAFTVSYLGQDGSPVEHPTEAGSYQVLAEITDPNYRHANAGDGAACQIGVLQIYQTSAPAVYSITFLPGAEDATGEPPSLPESIPASIHFLPGPGDLERAGYQFAGWEYGGRIYSAGTAFHMPARDVTFTASWTEASFEIGGSVVWGNDGDEGDDPQPAENVLVTLMRGNQEIAWAQTESDGTFSFAQVAPGVYNLVASYGEIIQTEKVQLVDQDETQCTIRLPLGKTNSVLKVLDGTPAVVVGNLEKVFTPEPDEVYTVNDRELVENGGTVEILMTVADASPAPDSSLDQAIAALSSRFQEGLTLDLTVEKFLENADGASLGSSSIPETNQIIDIVIPLSGELQSCRSYRVLREHEGAVDELGTSPNGQGEYYDLDQSKTVLTIHARQFSLYSILYSNWVPDYGDGDDDDDDDEKPQPVAEPPAEEELPAGELPPEPVSQSQPEIVPEPDLPDSPANDADSAPAQPETEPSGAAAVPSGKPFVLLNAAGALVSILLAIFGKGKGKDRLFTAACAAGAAVITLLTTGWQGITLANLWTIPVAVFVLLAVRYSRRPEGGNKE
jgi:uncharacterized repeat protein (TIGR02543 family)